MKGDPMKIEKCAMCGREGYESWFANNARCANLTCELYGIHMPKRLWNFIQQAVREKRERENKEKK